MPPSVTEVRLGVAGGGGLYASDLLEMEKGNL